jgi:putative two-component system response regulator
VASNHPKPDQILLGVMMPDINGYQVLAKLHDNCDTPVIFLTALTNSNDEERYLDPGAMASGG